MKKYLLLVLFSMLVVGNLFAQDDKLERIQNKDRIIRNEGPAIPIQKQVAPKKDNTQYPTAPNQKSPTWPYNNLPHQRANGHQNCKHDAGFCDPRDLPLSKNGKLLSVDGYEVDFRTSGNPQVTNTCGTPRGYVNATNNSRSAGCPFTVPCDNPANRDAASNAIKYFQLEWHVMQSTGGGASSNIDQTRINALMAELNADYAAHNMIFCADPANFYVDDANYNHDQNTEEVSLKTTYNVTPTQVINIYVVGTMSAGGYARFPYDPMGGTSPTGGIVLARGNCNLGTHTLAHEMGHTFGLEHTFAGVDERTPCAACYEQVRNANGSSNASGAATPFGGPYNTEGDQEGDWCSDTHPHDTYSYNCSTSSNPNNPCDAAPWANAPVNNHMSYSFCSSQFSTQQSYRMHCMVNTYLTSWTSYGGGICGAQPPVADFDGSPTTWVAPNNVNFNDLSTPQSIITGWEWHFDVAASGTVTCAGCVGANATFVGQTPPVVTYPNTGLYTVELIVSSPNGNDTLTRVDYIEVTNTGGDCDTLDTDWNTPAPTVTFFTGVNSFLTGVPCDGNVAAGDPAGFYQQYFTPNPGTSIVGAVTAGLGFLNDPNDNMTFQIVVYEDDAGNPGFPDFGAGPVAARVFSPTQMNVPTGNFYREMNLPFDCAPTITGTTFHVGVEMFPGDPTDTLILLTNQNGEGGSPLNNVYNTSNCGVGDFNTAPMQCLYGAIDFDLYCYPQMGWYEPFPQALGYVENVTCDTTEVAILTSTLYDGAGCAPPSGPNTGMVNWTYTFDDGTTISSPTEIPVLNRTYTSPGLETVTITALNSCGRADTTTWNIPYNFLSTPDADFTKNPQNPICMGAPGVNFTANTSGYADYTWDFGDGTVLSTGSSNTASHTYVAPGLYYVSLDVTSLGYQPVDTFYLETFATGWPAGYQRFNNDPFIPHPFVNPPFTGTDATAWIAGDIDGSGDNEAVSTSFNTNPAEQADDWMITTGIGPLPANQMLSWDGEAISAAFPDGYEVRISTVQLPANTANYGTVLFSTAAENAYRTTRTANLSAYAGQTVYIAFVNNSTNEYFLSIDNIRVGTIGPGCTNTEQKLDFVEIIDCTVIPPTASLNASDTVGCAPLTVTFTDTSTIGDPPTSWLWNFGDGQFSTLQNPPAHIYTTPGSYFVIFQACNSGGCTTDTTTIEVGDVIAANAGGDQSICGDVATLAGNDPTPYTGTWSVVNGAGTFTNLNLFNTNVTGLGAGVNELEWSIAGTNGCVDRDTVEVAGKVFIYGLNGATSNTYCTDAAGWHHFFNAGNEILLSIRGDLSGAPVGFPQISIADNGAYYQQTQGPFTPPSCASGLTPGEERFEMERSWNVDFGGGTLNPPYDVRFYYQPAERTAIETAAATHMATYPSCGYTYKYPNPLGFYWFKNTGANYTAPDYDGTQLPGAVSATGSGINYTEMTGVTSFSGGSGAVIVVPDPLLAADWLYFDGVTDNKVNYLRWATEREQNTSHFNLQRSKTGTNFETIANIAAQGNSSTTVEYNYDDTNPFTGENYYRLELVDADGDVTYSNTVLLVIAEDDLGYVFYPNPTRDKVYYQYEAAQAEQLQIEVIDVLGRVLNNKQATSVVGINNIEISLEEYPVGSYMVRVTNKATGSVHTSKIIKSKQ